MPPTTRSSQKLAESFHVYAPLIPGYGDSEECHEIRDMLDFTLHSWDVVDALGLKDPILVGHSMGGMIAAEMAAVCPNEVSRLALIAPAGLWLDDHPVADIFTKLPYEMPALLFHDAEAGKARLTTGLAMDDPKFLQTFLVTNARQLGMAGRLLFPDPRARIVRTAVPREGEDDPRLGRQRQGGVAGLCARFQAADQGRATGVDSRSRPHGHNGEDGAGDRGHQRFCITRAAWRT